MRFGQKIAALLGMTAIFGFTRKNENKKQVIEPVYSGGVHNGRRSSEFKPRALGVGVRPEIATCKKIWRNRHGKKNF